MTIKREVVIEEKITKKVDVKGNAKNEIMAIIHKALDEAGITYKDGVEFGMTKGTIVVEHKDSDVQIKPITPKAGITRYDLIQYK